MDYIDYTAAKSTLGLVSFSSKFEIQFFKYPEIVLSDAGVCLDPSNAT